MTPALPTLPADPALPGLATLTEDDLGRITGRDPVEVLRLRHHPGLRAAMHVATGEGHGRQDGVIWFLHPDKLTHLAATRPHLRVDAARGAAFEAFPMDHRLPALATFVAQAVDLAPDLIGTTAHVPPRLVRYRPGLSATFRWISDDGRTHFVKVARKADTAAQAALQRDLCRQCEGSALGLTAVRGHMDRLGTIAYAAAPGESLEARLAEDGCDGIDHAMRITLDALQVLWSCDTPGLPGMELADYLRPARRAAALIAEADAWAGDRARQMIAEAETSAPALRQVPIHADLKPDHVFIDGFGATLIDTESLKRGDPDFDLALLDARLDLGPLTGAFPAKAVAAARAALRMQAGPNFEWFHALARIHAAKFIAQNAGFRTVDALRGLLEP